MTKSVNQRRAEKLKVYVGARIRLRETSDVIVRKLQNAKNSEDGFASAEMIALAVVGILIVFGIYAIFSDVINNRLSKWINAVFDKSTDTSIKPPANPAP